MSSRKNRHIYYKDMNMIEFCIFVGNIKLFWQEPDTAHKLNIYKLWIKML